MSKQSTITNLLVMPLIASAVFLASPALASSPLQTANKAIRNEVQMTKNASGGHKSVAGTVKSISGTIIVITGVDNMNYTVDAGSAIIMKASSEPNTNPSVINIADIHVGDTVMIRGTLASDKTEITAEKIFDGKMPVKSIKHKMKNLRKGLKKAK